MSESVNALLRLDGISKTYFDGQPVPALRPTSMEVSEGGYLAVTGPSGSGKSTLLNVLGLLDTPTLGSYRINGVETVGLSDAVRGSLRGQLFGFVFQSFHLLPGRTAVENVEIGMLYGPRTPRERRKIATETLIGVGLGHRLNADPRTMSGGERQRVAIARAIAAKPRVLFCDEPTGNLDTANSQNVLRILDELNQEGLTVVVVTHDPDVAGRGSSHIAVADGVVKAT